MNLFSKDTQPAMSRRQYLRNLLQRATVRMRQDEEAAVAAPRSVSRRETMRWLGVAAIAAASGARPLRALADGVAPSGILRERAAISGGSPRYPAPQYGLPALPMYHEPYIRESDSTPTAETRKELADPKKWAADYVTFVDQKHGIMGGYPSHENVLTTRAICYHDASREKHTLEVIQSPFTKAMYVAFGAQSFYVEYDGDLWAFLIKDNKAHLRKSFYRRNGSEISFDDMIRSFAKNVSDKQLRTLENEATTIKLSEGASNLVIGVTAIESKVDIYCQGARKQTVDLKTKMLVE